MFLFRGVSLCSTLETEKALSCHLEAGAEVCARSAVGHWEAGAEVCVMRADVYAVWHWALPGENVQWGLMCMQCGIGPLRGENASYFMPHLAHLVLLLASSCAPWPHTGSSI